MKKSSTFTLIDMNVMYEIFGHNPQAIHGYLQRFVEITSDLLSKMQKAIQEKNEHLALSYFHKMKGPVGTIGFKDMLRLCEMAEEKIKVFDWDAAKDYCQKIEIQLNKLEKDAERYFSPRR